MHGLPPAIAQPPCSALLAQCVEGNVGPSAIRIAAVARVTSLYGCATDCPDAYVRDELDATAAIYDRNTEVGRDAL